MDKIAAVLTKQIDEKVVLLQNSLSDGRAKDYAEYQRLVGEIRGLLTARQYIAILNNKMETYDE
jgi:hypothetical protein